VGQQAEIFQYINLPGTLGVTSLRFWWRAEATQTQPPDHLIAYVEKGSDYEELVFLQSTGPLNKWQKEEVAFPARIRGLALLGFVAGNDASVPTTFRVDNIELLCCGHFLDLPLILR
jgi:hypothetical protein